MQCLLFDYSLNQYEIPGFGLDGAENCISLFPGWT